MQEITINSKQSRTLTAIRDALLPKLLLERDKGKGCGEVCGGGIRKLRDMEMRRMFLSYSKKFSSVDMGKLFKSCYVFF